MWPWLWLFAVSSWTWHGAPRSVDPVLCTEYEGTVHSRIVRCLQRHSRFRCCWRNGGCPCNLMCCVHLGQHYCWSSRSESRMTHARLGAHCALDTVVISCLSGQLSLWDLSYICTFKTAVRLEFLHMVQFWTDSCPLPLSYSGYDKAWFNIYLYGDFFAAGKV